MSTHGTLHHQVGAARRTGTRQLSLSPARLRRARPEVEDSWAHATKLIDALGGDSAESLSSAQCQILKTRWLEQWKMYERLWRSQRSIFYLLRVPIIIGATIIPVLASLNVDKVATALVGLGVAMLTALDSFFQLGMRWQQHRHTSTQLGFEGWMFLERIGAYATKTTHQAYEAFITRLEAMNRRAALAYPSVFRSTDNGEQHHREGTK